MFTVYLAGPITGLTHDESVGWRNEFQKLYFDILNKSHANEYLYNVHFLSPMRGKDYLKEVGVIQDSYTTFDCLATEDGIIGRDYNDCKRSNALIVNLLNTKIVSIGTVMELAWCYDMHKPAILIMDKNNIHNHPFVRRCSNFKVETLEQATFTLRQIIG